MVASAPLTLPNPDGIIGTGCTVLPELSLR